MQNTTADLTANVLPTLPFTYIDVDGVWYAETADLVEAMFAVGYRAEEYQGFYVAKAPASIYAYSELCARVGGMDGDDLSDGMLEALEFDEQAFSGGFLLSEGLYNALLAKEIA